MTPDDMTPIWDDEDYWALYRSVVEHPKERTPRYILADWLDERGYAAQALKHRLDGVAKKEIASVDNRGYVSIANCNLTSAAFWKEVVRFHDEKSETVLIVGWHAKARHHYPNIGGPLYMVVPPKAISDDENYQRLLSIPNLFGVFLRTAGIQYWSNRIADDFPNIHALGWMVAQPEIPQYPFASLSQLEDLHFIAFNGSWTFAKECHSLKHLTIGDGRPTSEESMRMALLPIESLHADFAVNPLDPLGGLQIPPMVPKAKQLQVLRWGVDDTPDELLRGLGDLDQLERLEINVSPHPDIRFPGNLRALSMPMAPLDEQPNPAVLPTSLTNLTLVFNRFQKPNLAVLEPLDQLRRFEPVVTFGTKLDVTHLLNRPRLRIFKMSRCAMPEDTLKRLIAIPSLRLLDLSGSGTNSNVIERIRKKAPHIIIQTNS